MINKRPDYLKQDDELKQFQRYSFDPELVELVRER